MLFIAIKAELEKKGLNYFNPKKEA